MKFLKYLPFALAIALMVGCSDDNVTLQEEESSELMADGGSVSIRINLPSTTAVTRATEAELADGLSQEYAVNDGTIILFDAQERFVTKQTFTGSELNFTANTANNITSSSVEVKIGPNLKTPKYAAVYLNMTTAAATELVYSTFNETKSPINGPNNAIVDVNGNGYFFMSNSTFDNSNAPTSVYHSTSGLQTLQELDPASVKSTSATTNSNEATTNIYVERASVKVELTFTNASNQANEVTGSTAIVDATTGLPTITFTAGANVGDQITVTGWTLNATNKTYYSTKLIDATNWADWLTTTKYFMAPYVSRPSDFRSHFGIDTNYDGSTLTNSATQGFYEEFNYASLSQAINPSKTTATSTGVQYLYCLENTFDVDNQEQNQTTSLLIAANYKQAGNADTSGDIFKLGTTIYGGNGVSLINHLVTVLNANGYQKVAGTTGTTPSAIVAADLKINKGNYIYKDLILPNNCSIVFNGNVVAAMDTSMDAILNSVLGYRAISYYKGGNCFYSVPIRHFNDEQVPLLDATGNYVSFNGTVTHVNNTDQLGRYGVLRNNWYSAEVSSISSIGRPVPVSPTDPINPDPSYPDPQDPDPNNPAPTPDDVVNTYLQAKINILPWAKRSQKIKL